MQETLRKAEQEERRGEAQQQQKERKLQETASFLKSLVRRSSTGPLGTREKEQSMQARIKASADEYRATLRANKKKIKEAVAHRPSLIERQEQVIPQTTPARLLTS